MQTIQIAGEQLEMWPERAIYWPDSNTLIIADTHFGKAATFRVSGIPVPQGTTKVMLERINELLNKTGANRLLILGDLIHSSKRTKLDFVSELIQWRNEIDAVEVTLVKGNHDRGKTDLFEQLNIQVVDEPLIEPPFAFCHYMEANQSHQHYTLAGHLHPAVSLEFLKKREKWPCFVFHENYAIMPAFGEFVGHAVIERADNQRIFIVADDQVIEMDLVSQQR